MKKNTLTALYNYFVKNDDTIDLSAVVEDIRAEYEKSAAKAMRRWMLTNRQSLLFSPQLRILL